MEVHQDSDKQTWKTIGAKMKESDLPTLNQRLHVFGYETLWELVHDIAVGKLPQVTQGSSNAPTFWNKVNYEGMYRYYRDLRKYSHGYARELTSYFRRYADQFFKEPESLHKLSNHKRAWVLNAMRAFGVYYEYYTKGNRDANDQVHNLIRRYQPNRGLDIHF